MEEIFASAQEHGESESQVIARLGDPKTYAREVAGPLGRRRGGLTLVGLVLSCSVCVGAFSLFLSTAELWVPGDAIGHAQGSTSIQVLGAVDLLPRHCWLLVQACLGERLLVWLAARPAAKGVIL